jgi:hypothetical protein
VGRASRPCWSWAPTGAVDDSVYEGCGHEEAKIAAMERNNGHELEVDRHATRRYRDVWVLRCGRCGLTARVGMRERASMAEKIARLQLDPCPGKRPEPPERLEPRGHAHCELIERKPLEIPSGGIFYEEFPFTLPGEGED